MAKNGTRGRRRSKAESMTGAKENAVEVRKLGGDNAPKLELPSREDFEHHLRTIKGYTEKKDTAVANLRNAVKAAEKSCKGLGGTISELMKLERADDHMEFQRRMELLGYGLKLTDSPVQITIFDALAGDVEDQAYKRGLADGKAGKTADNRYPEGSPLSAKYADGWRHGQADNLGLTAEQADEAIHADGIPPLPPGLRREPEHHSA